MIKPRLVVLSFLTLALSGSWASANAPAGRYTVSNGVVYDTRTRLSWEQTPPSSALAWLPAKDHCSSLGTGWRLPTYKELFTIVDFSRTAPAIDSSAFPGTVSAAYWSMTFRPSDTESKLRTVNFSNGAPNFTDAGTTAYVRCVR